MWQAVLFDLDDTLIIADNARLMRTYFRDVAECFPTALSPEHVRRQIVDSTLHLMGADDGEQLVIDRFADHFFTALDLPADMSIFADYYAGEYARLGRFARPARGAREVVQEAADLGLRVVLATNSVFPKSAIQQRLAWGGLEDIAWDLMTSLENMHYSKPQPGYFAEIAQHLGLKASACLMVGNDPANDLSAQLVGMKTFLVTGERPAMTEEEIEAERVTARAIEEPLLQLEPSSAPSQTELVPDLTGTLEDLRQLLRRACGLRT